MKLAKFAMWFGILSMVFVLVITIMKGEPLIVQCVTGCTMPILALYITILRNMK